MRRRAGGGRHRAASLVRTSLAASSILRVLSVRVRCEARRGFDGLDAWRDARGDTYSLTLHMPAQFFPSAIPPSRSLTPTIPHSHRERERTHSFPGADSSTRT
jgi:hypothetical protein